MAAHQPPPPPPPMPAAPPAHAAFKGLGLMVKVTGLMAAHQPPPPPPPVPAAPPAHAAVWSRQDTLQALRALLDESRVHASQQNDCTQQQQRPLACLLRLRRLCGPLLLCLSVDFGKSSAVTQRTCHCTELCQGSSSEANAPSIRQPVLTSQRVKKCKSGRVKNAPLQNAMTCLNLQALSSWLLAHSEAHMLTQALAVQSYLGGQVLLWRIVRLLVPGQLRLGRRDVGQPCTQHSHCRTQAPSASVYHLPQSKLPAACR